jgi:hypothetical protein
LKIQVSHLKIAPGFSRGKLVFSRGAFSRGGGPFSRGAPLENTVSPLKIPVLFSRGKLVFSRGGCCTFAERKGQEPLALHLR